MVNSAVIIKNAVCAILKMLENTEMRLYLNFSPALLDLQVEHKSIYAWPKLDSRKIPNKDVFLYLLTLLKWHVRRF